MRVPSYLHHKATGQAYVKLAGKFIYLGRYGSEESRQKYEQTIGQWLASGRQLPEPTIAKTSLTVGQLYATYLEHCREYYQRDGKPTGEYDSHVYLRAKIESITSPPVNSVSPATIETLRQKWIAAGNSRKFICIIRTGIIALTPSLNVGRLRTHLPATSREARP